jgi:2-hydroxy-3-keto-5-methylthiopentenyl-1-phosphate phosphatase
MNYTFFCDFDGTVTREDVIGRMLEVFADPSWMEIEQSWIRGDIGSRDCLDLQIRLVKAKESELFALVETIEIDESFVDFTKYCHSKAIEVVILSDGIDLFIHSILGRYGLDHLRVYANRLRKVAEGFEMTFPYFRAECERQSGICKCKIMEKLSRPIHRNVLVGDGHSDFCLAHKVDLTFAKSSLLTFCRTKRLVHKSFNDFKEVTEWLSENERQERESFPAESSVRYGGNMK